jgi:hypothetical protein
MSKFEDKWYVETPIRSFAPRQNIKQPTKMTSKYQTKELRVCMNKPLHTLQEKLLLSKNTIPSSRNIETASKFLLSIEFEE